MMTFLTVLLVLVVLNVVLLIFSVNAAKPSPKKEKTYILSVKQNELSERKLNDLKKAV